MLDTILSSIIAMILSMAVMGLGWLLSKRAMSDREKNSPFECGFDPMKSARVPFALRFFLLAIIFLIFDVEIVLLFPMLVSTSSSFTLGLLFGGVIFLIVLLLGVFHEWAEGSLDWVWGDNAT